LTPDLDQLSRLHNRLQANPEAQQTAPQDILGGGARKRIDYMASHMLHQLKEHEAAQERTSQMFEQLLQQLEETVVSFQQSFLNREVPIGSIYARIDADRSVGILYLLWHTISFTVRGNTKPMALSRNGRDPLFSGRIIALKGDYHENVMSLQSQEYPDLLEDELASLYIPASPVQPAVMRFQHNKEELFFHQAEATQQFLLKLLEAICSGGFVHESFMD
jgi:hypothetical protein